MASLTRDTPRLIMEYLVSLCARTGNFDRVNNSEPKSAPTGFDCAVWQQTLRPAASGLTYTSVRAEYSIRFQQNMLAEDGPEGSIEAFLAMATWDVMAALTADLTLGGLVRVIPVLGEDGDGLNSEAGYIQIEKTMFRAVTITVPCLISDAWEQVRKA